MIRFQSILLDLLNTLELWVKEWASLFGICNIRKMMLRVGAAQISPVWLNKAKTLEKVLAFMERAKQAECDVVAFGEALVPGYPYWLEATNGCQFNNKVQKEIFAHYSRESVRIRGENH